MHAELQDYQRLGVDWVRVDFHWDLVQPVKDGGYNWSLVDKVINAVNGYGLEVVAILNDPPAWAGETLSTTTGQQAFASFARTAAARYGDRVDYWEILNEPNKASISAANYTKALKLAYAEVKAIDSGDAVITAGLSPVPQSANGFVGAVEYLSAMYANGAKNYFDAVGFNPYSWPLLPSDSKSWNGWQIMEDGIRGTMVANGDSAKQVWVAEFGAPTGGGGSSVAQAAQAAMLSEAVSLASATSWVGPIMYYSYKDRGGSANTENYFGLLTATGERKAAWYTYQALATNDDDASVNGGSTTHAFTSLSRSAKITNFANGDKIDLSVIDADATVTGKQVFNFVGSKWLSKTADLGVYKNATGNFTEVQAYVDGDRKYDLAIRISGLHDLDATDFILTTGEVFKFTSVSRSLSIATYADGDKIDLSAIDANSAVSGNQTFTFVGSNWLSNPGDLGVYRSGSTTYVQGDLDGDTAFDFSIRIAGLHDLSAADFIL